jgi:polygalacturonase
VRLDRRQLIGGGAGLLASGCASVPRVEDDWARADAIVAGIQPPRIPPRQTRITEHGARPGDHDALPAVLAAIGAMADAGGGRVIVPAGDWRLDGPIHLRSGVDLHVEDEAVVRFTQDARFYPTVFTRWEGTEVFNHSPLIYGRGLTDVAVTGAGRFEGGGRDYWFTWRPEQRPDQTLLRQMGADGVPVSDRVFGLGRKLRPAFVQFIECRRVLIEGPSFADSPFWVIHPVYCDHVTVRGIGVVSRHLNSDGCDPDSCTNVLIEGCRFDVSDDCVAVKSGRDQDGWRVARPSRAIVVQDCEMRTDIAAAFAIGSEMSGGANDIWVRRLAVPHAEHALYFKANLDRGGVIERIRIKDVAVEKTESLIHFTTDYHSWRGGNFPPTYRDFRVEEVRCVEAEQALRIAGVPSAPVQGVLLRNVTCERATEPDLIRDTRRLRLEGVRVNGREVTAPA